MVSLTFHGAAGTVTGSKYLLECEGARLLIDCGLFQGLKELRLKNWDQLPFAASSVKAVVLTHAHIDHTGYLPRLANQGFHGPVYCTPATAKLTELLLFDSAFNQQEDADYANRKGFSKHHPALPLYDRHDVAHVLRQLRPLRREEWLCPVKPFWVRLHDAGHLLGSTMIEVEVREGPEPLRILFSGDVGRYGAPLYHNPHPPTPCDYLICECTYGNRDHATGDVLDSLCQVVLESLDRGGVMLFPSFAVGRAQQLIFLLQSLLVARRIPEIPIYVDSPMALDATNIYMTFSDEQNFGSYGEALARLSETQRALHGRNVHLVRSRSDSKRLNSVTGPAVIISSSGMMVGGRILHHLKQRLPDPRNTIVLGGFMAAGTRGRKLQEGATTLRMHGYDVPVRAALAEVSGLSGHADRNELLRWLEPLTAPRTVYLTHGEPDSAAAFAERLRETRQWNVHIPQLYERVEWEHGS